MESKQFARRTLVLILLMGVLLFTLGAALYDAQIINGEEWAAASVIKITNEESVSSARGAILDRYGRVLVSNRVTYQVTLNTGLMGEDRNEILLELIRLARAAGVEWADSLSVSQHAPFAFTRDDPFCYVYADEEGNTVRALTNLGRLSVLAPADGRGAAGQAVRLLRHPGGGGGVRQGGRRSGAEYRGYVPLGRPGPGRSAVRGEPPLPGDSL